MPAPRLPFVSDKVLKLRYGPLSPGGIHGNATKHFSSPFEVSDAMLRAAEHDELLVVDPPHNHIFASMGFPFDSEKLVDEVLKAERLPWSAFAGESTRADSGVELCDERVSVDITNAHILKDVSIGR